MFLVVSVGQVVAGDADAAAPVQKLAASDGAIHDSYGYAVSLAGDVVVVGAAWQNSYQGAAYAYERDAGGTNNWGEVKKLLASDGTARDYFGSSVSVAGTVAVAGAPGKDSSRGAAYVYESVDTLPPAMPIVWPARPTGTESTRRTGPGRARRRRS